MATMDLSINQELMGVQKNYEVEYGSHIIKLQEAFQQTNIRGNNNFLNLSRTETSDSHVSCNSNLLFQANRNKDNDFEVDNSLFSYTSFKKAMDLRIHNRFVDEANRTIFDDAEYFAKNCCYKLLPISFEQVDETIIHTEHNYSLFSLDSESEGEEDCSRMMDYSQIREKNYKKRRAKSRECIDRKEKEANEIYQDNLVSVSSDSEYNFPPPSQAGHTFAPDEESPFLGQPLDLSAPPAVQDNKTEPLASIPEETGQPDSDKENAGGELGGIRVTITRPDEKDSYQPCDRFLNDIARLVPWLIDKDCFEVDILDRTCGVHENFRKHRLYYVIAESTWRFFQSTNERIILTNDSRLGQPLRRPESEERPSYLVFDQFSLAKCLADYCQEIGGCFEYTCVEEGKEEEAGERNAVEMSEEERGMTETEESAKKGSRKDMKSVVEEEEEVVTEKARKQNDIDLNKLPEKSEYSTMAGAASEQSVEVIPETDDQANGHFNEKEDTKKGLHVRGEIEKSEDASSIAKATKRVGKEKRKKKADRSKRERKRPTQTQARNPIQTQAQNLSRPEPKSPRITTRWKSTSEVETSQTSDKPVSRKRWGPAPPTQLPPIKRRRAPKAEEATVRSRRSESLGEVKTTLVLRRKQEKKDKKDEKKEGNKGKGRQIVNKRILRSMKAEGKKKEKEKIEGKGKGKGKPATSGKARKR